MWRVHREIRPRLIELTARPDIRGRVAHVRSVGAMRTLEREVTSVARDLALSGSMPPPAITRPRLTFVLGTTMDFRLADALPILERTPRVLRAWLADLPEAWTTPNEGGDTWSAFQVLGHLIDGEIHDWIPRARIVLAGGPNPAFEPFDRFRHLTAYAHLSLAARLDRFEALRAKTSRRSPASASTAPSSR